MLEETSGRYEFGGSIWSYTSWEVTVDPELGNQFCKSDEAGTIDFPQNIYFTSGLFSLLRLRKADFEKNPPCSHHITSDPTTYLKCFAFPIPYNINWFVPPKL